MSDSIELNDLFKARGCGKKLALTRYSKSFDKQLQDVLIKLLRGYPITTQDFISGLVIDEGYQGGYIDLFETYRHEVETDLIDRYVHNGNFNFEAMNIQVPVSRVLMHDNRKCAEIIYTSKKYDPMAVDLFGRLAYTLLGGMYDVIVRWFCSKPMGSLKYLKSGKLSKAVNQHIHPYILRREIEELNLDSSEYSEFEEKLTGYVESRFINSSLVNQGVLNLEDYISRLAASDRQYSEYCGHCPVYLKCIS